jgi:hypothetical protein
MTAHLIVFVLAAHYVGDFTLQTRWMARNKSEDFLALGSHAATYTATLVVLLGGFATYFGLMTGWEVVGYGLLNGAVHMAVDALTSRVSSHAHRVDDDPMFWNVIGFDQFIHATTLIYSLAYVTSN